MPMTPYERRAAAIMRDWLNDPDLPRPFKLELWGEEASPVVKVIAKVIADARLAECRGCMRAVTALIPADRNTDEDRGYAMALIDVGVALHARLDGDGDDQPDG